jgi:hypothetical protein
MTGAYAMSAWCPAVWRVEVVGRGVGTGQVSADCVAACVDHADEATRQIADVLVACRPVGPGDAQDLLVRYPGCTAVLRLRPRITAGRPVQ